MNQFKVSLSLISLLLLSNLSFGQSTCAAQMQYCFDGNANDETGNGQNGNVVNAVLTAGRNGNANSAYEFSGSSSYVSIPSSSIAVDDYSYSLWINPSQNPSSGEAFAALSIGAPGKDQAIYTFNTSAGSGINFGSYPTSGSPDNIKTNFLPTTNTWHHIVCTRGNGYMKIYVNGVLEASKFIGTKAAGYASPLSSSIGARHRTTQYWKGKIDDVGIFKCVLTANEIIDLYNSSSYCQPNSSGCAPIVQHCFNGNADDESGNGQHGVNNNAQLNTGRNGVFNTAYSFDSAGEHISIPSDSILLDNFTYASWVKPSQIPSFGQSYTILSVGGPVKDQFMYLADAAGGKGFCFSSYLSDGSSYTVCSDELPNTDEWYHVAGTRDNDTIKIFVNGVLKDKRTVYGLSAGYATPFSSKIGARYQNTQTWQGSIDDVSIYPCTFTNAEVLNLYQTDSTCEDVDIYAGEVLSAPVVGESIDRFRVFPNPSNGLIHIEFLSELEGTEISLELFDIKGQQLATSNHAVATGDDRIELDYSSIGAGTYFLRVTTGNQVAVKRVVIQ